MIKLQVKVISWLFIILTAFLCVLQIESINTNFLELAAFEDFLRSQHLNQVLVVRGPADGDATGDWQIECQQKLLANYRVQFYRPGMLANFEDLSVYDSPRTAVLVLNFKHTLIKRRVFQPASEAGYFNNSLAWFIFGATEEFLTDEQVIDEHFRDYKMAIDADITVAMRSLDNSSWQLYDLYRVRQQLPLIIQRRGEWSSLKGYQLLDRSSRVARRNNFFNITLVGSTPLTEKPPGYDDMAFLADYVHLQQFDPMSRKTYQFFQLITEMFNFRLEIMFTDKWGEMLKDGSWSGVMGHVTSGAADFAVCPMRFVLDRLDSVHYSPVLHTQPVHFLFRHPRRNHIRNIFFEPLSNQVWWCVLVLVTVSTFLLLLHVRQEIRERRSSSVEQRMGFAWFTMLETFLQQGPAPEVFWLTSTRVLIYASGIFSFILMQFYGAFIVGSLLSDYPRSIVNLQALYDSNLAIGMENITYNYALFSNTTNQLVKDVYAKKICHAGEHNILGLEQGAMRVMQGRFAFHTALDRLYRLLIDLRMGESEFCELQEIMFNPPYVTGSVTVKGSPWREHLARAVLHLQATGLMQYNDRRWMVSRPDCSLFKTSRAEVDLEHFAPALFTLALAMMASALVFLLELFLHWLPDLRGRLEAMST
ncbi:ionotropic receptor 75a [Drosophila bipectinata]|uniref:ionotropic receptor 75a n=1 Tax=Drosophila bipectinata TaxID=42026 RepID=UPI001C8AB84C|nr:glutamate [NMDA] receptor subunit 1 [Drosophila bipectinata]